MFELRFGRKILERERNQGLLNENKPYIENFIIKIIFNLHI